MASSRTQLVRFAAVGASNTLVTLAAYAAAARLLPYLAAAALGYALGGLNGFLLNRAWTFGRPGHAARYAVVVGLGLAADNLLLRAGAAFGLPRDAVVVAALAPVTLLTFALSRAWAFGQDAQSRPPRVALPRRALRLARAAGAGRGHGRPAPASDRG